MRANLALHVNESNDEREPLVLLDADAIQREDDTSGVFKKTTLLHVKNVGSLNDKLSALFNEPTHTRFGM